MTDDTYDEVLAKAVEKFALLYPGMPDGPYVLLTKSFEKVDVIPCFNKKLSAAEQELDADMVSFSVGGYKAFVGKPFQQILLFVAPQKDFDEVNTCMC